MPDALAATYLVYLDALNDRRFRDLDDYVRDEFTDNDEVLTRRRYADMIAADTPSTDSRPGGSRPSGPASAARQSPHSSATDRRCAARRSPPALVDHAAGARGGDDGRADSGRPDQRRVRGAVE
ncbi:hypothetical protein [Pseudonocardia humida]|uniref:SnoaL-like protein n=1 Tax=Pseudonocardia humida TaxID=2800819 RepID=A0ABT1AAB7_9PSEU|nr:hypothetical protein [Pseudonocardia humida]MCO1659759.1 hypothetical protein [Pseudonocardia humida]